jgi:hypothetical protein
MVRALTSVGRVVSPEPEDFYTAGQMVAMYTHRYGQMALRDHTQDILIALGAWHARAVWCTGPLWPLRPPVWSPPLAFPSDPVLRSRTRRHRLVCACCPCLLLPADGPTPPLPLLRTLALGSQEPLTAAQEVL